MAQPRATGAAGAREYLRQNVLALVALFVALGGTAWAAATIGPRDIERDAVRARHIKAGQVGATDVDPGAVQRRVDGTCQAGSTISAVNQDGSVVCQADGGGPPTGAAGGDLTGDYPNPQLDSIAIDYAFSDVYGDFPDLQIDVFGVGAGNLTPDAIPADGSGQNGSSKVATDAVGGQELRADSVHASDIINGTIEMADLGQTARGLSGTVPANGASVQNANGVIGLTKPATGVYCLSPPIGFDVSNMIFVATPRGLGSFSTTFTYFPLIVWQPGSSVTDCSAGTIEVHTYRFDGEEVDLYGGEHPTTSTPADTLDPQDQAFSFWMR